MPLGWCEVSDFPDLKLSGFPRKDGRWGFRNYILIFPLHSALSALTRKVADEIGNSNVVTIAHDWSGELDKDWERISRSISGFCANPNNFATIFVGLGNEVESGLIKSALDIGIDNHEVLKLSSFGSSIKSSIKVKVACFVVSPSAKIILPADPSAGESVPWLEE